MLHHLKKWCHNNLYGTSKILPFALLMNAMCFDCMNYEVNIYT